MESSGESSSDEEKKRKLASAVVNPASFVNFKPGVSAQREKEEISEGAQEFIASQLEEMLEKNIEFRDASKPSSSHETNNLKSSDCGVKLLKKSKKLAVVDQEPSIEARLQRKRPRDKPRSDKKLAKERLKAAAVEATWIISEAKKAQRNC